MTIDERKMLATYRQQGYGYKKIAQIMGLSVNTVKTYCKRNALGGKVDSQNPGTMEKVCQYCGAPLAQTPGRKPRVFCSDGCRTKWWNAHLWQELPQKNHRLQCGLVLRHL